MIVAARSWSRRADLPRRTLVWIELQIALVPTIVGVVLIANLSTVLDAEPALFAVYATGR